MDARKGRQVRGGCGVRPALHDAYQHPAQAVGESGRYRQAVFVPHRAPYVRHDDADARCGLIYDLETARSYGCEDDAGVRQNRQSQKRRGGQSREWIVRLIRNRARFGKWFTLLRGRIEEKESKPFLRAEYIVLNKACKYGVKSHEYIREEMNISSIEGWLRVSCSS